MGLPPSATDIVSTMQRNNVASMQWGTWDCALREFTAQGNSTSFGSKRSVPSLSYLNSGKLPNQVEPMLNQGLLYKGSSLSPIPSFTIGGIAAATRSCMLLPVVVGNQETWERQGQLFPPYISVVLMVAEIRGAIRGQTSGKRGDSMLVHTSTRIHSLLPPCSTANFCKLVAEPPGVTAACAIPQPV